MPAVIENLVNFHGTKYMHKGNENRRVPELEVENYLLNGWCLGMAKRSAEEIAATNAKRIKTCIEKYGVPQVAQIESVREAKKRTCLERYGAESPLQSDEIKEKIKQYNMQRYGVPYHIMSQKLRGKIKEHNIEKFGVELPFQSEEIREKCRRTCKDRYGVDNPFQISDVIKKCNTKDSIEKGWNTKKQNHKCKTSKPEDDYYTYLIDTYGEDHVKRNYHDDPRYPFACDFYIDSEDLFIELNLSWVHGSHPYDSKSKNDQDKLQKWNIKAANSSYYRTAIMIWTERDVMKLNTARKHNLNFVRVYWNARREFVYYDLWD